MDQKTQNVLLVWEEVPENLSLYLVSVTPEQMEVLKQVNGCYINTECMSEEDEQLLNDTVLSALCSDSDGYTSPDNKWNGIWVGSKLESDVPVEIPAAVVIRCGFFM